LKTTTGGGSGSRETKRLLLIAYEMPPRWGPHALRVANICKYLSAYGWQVKGVGCAPWEGLEDPALGSAIPRSAVIVRIPQGRSGGKLSSVVWTLRAARAAARLAADAPVDVLLSSAPQYLSHMAGCLVSWAIGVPWVTDSGDPFAWNAGYRRGRAGRRLAKAIDWFWVRRARRVITVTDGAARQYREAFGSAAGKMAVIPLGYEPNGPAGALPRPEEKFRLGFAGSFHPEMTNGPKEFFRGISLACGQDADLARALEVEIISRDSPADCIRETVSEEHWPVISLVGHVPDMNDMLDRLGRTSCLVVWGFRGGLQIPSKIFLYFGLKKPVLALIIDGRDELKTIVEKARRGLAVDDNREKIAEALLTLYRMHRNGTLRSAFSCDDLDQYTWPHLMKRMDELLEEVARGARDTRQV
jgi:glycosyltransferase involved in cell wall biosynthesis